MRRFITVYIFDFSKSGKVGPGITKIYKIFHGYFFQNENTGNSRGGKNAKSFSSSSIKKTSTNILMAHKSAPKADTAHKQKNSIPTSQEQTEQWSWRHRAAQEDVCLVNNVVSLCRRMEIFMVGEETETRTRRWHFSALKCFRIKKILKAEWIMGSIHYLQ